MQINLLYVNDDSMIHGPVFGLTILDLAVFLCFVRKNYVNQFQRKQSSPLYLHPSSKMFGGFKNGKCSYFYINCQTENGFRKGKFLKTRWRNFYDLLFRLKFKIECYNVLNKNIVIFLLLKHCHTMP